MMGIMPDQAAIRALQHIAWSSSAASLHLVHSPSEQIHQAVIQIHGPVVGGAVDVDSAPQPDADDVALCREALEVLAVCLALVPDMVDLLYKDRTWQSFIVDVLLICQERSGHVVTVFILARFIGQNVTYCNLAFRRLSDCDAS